MFSYLQISSDDINMFISSKNHYTEIPWNVSSLNKGNAPYIGKANFRPKEYNTQLKKILFDL